MMNLFINNRKWLNGDNMVHASATRESFHSHSAGRLVRQPWAEVSEHKLSRVERVDLTFYTPSAHGSCY